MQPFNLYSKVTGGRFRIVNTDQGPAVETRVKGQRLQQFRVREDGNIAFREPPADYWQLKAPNKAWADEIAMMIRNGTSPDNPGSPFALFERTLAALGWPAAVTFPQLVRREPDLRQFSRRGFRRSVAGLLADCGYDKFPNPETVDGRWRLADGKAIIYARADAKREEIIAALDIPKPSTVPTRYTIEQPGDAPAEQCKAFSVYIKQCVEHWNAAQGPTGEHVRIL